MGQALLYLEARDISDLSVAQERLRRSEETFRKIFDASLDAMTIVDGTTGAYIDVNPEFLRATGFSRDDIIGKPATLRSSG